ncbi:dynein intermediate chain 3, ciliary [Synchiropus splendidus]|uniref:dynein intermediate chain 3, ciliary n=1 Tax=Synchiropus splendidus TaxID=270530 RepID=UPI00237EAA44|nr:dynein intermediate chain 3, ciliary [Synchiropus splendidus]XP_053707594.1 dynein intermediate chain 3, ciliary [Synchiropus splendidus]
MEQGQEYTKTGDEVGGETNFSDRPAELMLDLPSDPDVAQQLTTLTYQDRGVQSAPNLSEHEVNTERIKLESCGVNHVEGGWPKEVNPNDPEQKSRYLKKTERDDNYVATVLQLSRVMEHCIRQTNTMDIYEEYFLDEEEDGPKAPIADDSQEPPPAKTLNMFRDPNQLKRTVTGLSWHPDNGRTLAAAFSCPEYQGMSADQNMDSYIWDIENPHCPEVTLSPHSPLLCLEYNPKDCHILVGGSYNGQIVVWDTRKGCRPVEVSAMDQSHQDPVYKTVWLQSKTGTDAFSTSTDGQVLWWDVRKLTEPTESLVLDPGREGNRDRAYAAVSLEFEGTMPTKFMVGTEEGVVVSCNRKAKTPAEKIVCNYTSHTGPIHALQRNPFFPKNFLTVGDWTARIWSEDIRDSSIMCIRQMSSLMDACWSPVRPAVFFTVKTNGVLDVWDVLFKQSVPTLSLQVCDEALHSLRVQEGGRLVACGSELGDITLMEVSSEVSEMQRNEKGLMSELFERETRREKFHESRRREVQLKERSRSEQSRHDEGGGEAEEEEESPDELIARAEELFFKTLEPEPEKKGKKS